MIFPPLTLAGWIFFFFFVLFLCVFFFFFAFLMAKFEILTREGCFPSWRLCIDSN